MKLAHRPRIASTTIKLILKQILLSVHYINFIKNNSANRRWPEAQIVVAISRMVCHGLLSRHHSGTSGLSLTIWSAQRSGGRPLERRHDDGGVEARMSMAWVPGCRRHMCPKAPLCSKIYLFQVQPLTMIVINNQ